MTIDRDFRRRDSDFERRTSGPQAPPQQSIHQVKDQLAAKERELADIKNAIQAGPRQDALMSDPTSSQVSNPGQDSQTVDAMLIVSIQCV